MPTKALLSSKCKCHMKVGGVEVSDETPEKVFVKFLIIDFEGV